MKEANEEKDTMLFVLIFLLPFFDFFDTTPYTITAAISITSKIINIIIIL